jgi:signal transduction histidine kinase
LALTLKDSATTLHRLLENLLQWSHIQRGLMPFNPKSVQLRIVAEESIALIIDSVREKEIEITNTIPEGFVVFADIDMLQSIMRNVVSNAVKFTPKGGKMSLSAKSTEYKSVEILIKDTGIGMNQVIVNNLFKLDAQTNRIGTEGEPSSGLGLLLCKEFIEKHSGKIWVESEEGKGSVFHLTFPSHLELE